MSRIIVLLVVLTVSLSVSTPAQKPELVVQAGHTWRISSLVFSNDGRLMATASGERGDGLVKLWEVASGRNIRTLSGHEGGVNALAFSPDGRLLASGGEDDTIRIWDVVSGREMKRFYVPTDGVQHLLFGPDGRHLVSTSLAPFYGRDREPTHVTDDCPNIKDKPGFCEAQEVTVWDVQGGRFLFNILRPQIEMAKAPSDVWWNTAFSPDGQTLAVGVDKFEMQLWNVATQKQLPVLPKSSAPFVFDGGHRLASATLDGDVVVWDTANGREGTRLHNAGEPVTFSGHDTRLVTVTGPQYNETVHAWNIATGTETGTLVPDPELNCANCHLHISGDGRWVARGGDGNPKLILWDMSAPEKPPRLWQDLLSPVVFSPDGKRLAAVTTLYYNQRTATNSIWLLDLTSGEQSCATAGRLLKIGAMAVNPAGAQLAVASGSDVNIWDLAAGTRGKSLEGGDHSISSLAFSDDGRWLVSGYSVSNLAITWMPGLAGPGAKALAAKWDEPPCRAPVSSTAPVPPVTGGIWDMQTLAGHPKLPPMASPATISHDGKKIASATEGAVVNVWNVADATAGQIRDERSGRMIASETTMVRALAISPDNRWLVTAMQDDSFFKVWDMATYKHVATLNVPPAAPPKTVNGRLQIGYSTDIIALAFNPATGTLASGSEDGTVRLWNIEERREVSPGFKVEGSYWLDLKFSSDGLRLAVIAGNHGEIWDPRTSKRTATLATAGYTVNDAAFSGDGKTIFTGGDDGLTRVWETGSGRLLATMVSLDNDDWVVVDPDGRWDASDGAQRMMHYIRETKDYGYEIIDFSQLKDLYYEPHLLQKLLGFSKESLRPVVGVNEFRPAPEVVSQRFDEGARRLTVTIKSRGGGVGKTEVFVNDALKAADIRTDAVRKDPDVAAGQTLTFTAELPDSAFIKGKPNKIRVVTSNYLKELGKGNYSRGAEIVYTARGKEDYKLPTLYAIVGGVSDYAGDAIDLHFAAKDAEDFANALKLGGKRLFCDKDKPDCVDKVQVTVLSTSGNTGTIAPTKENFKKAFAAIAAVAGPDDILVLYLAGHGVTFGQGTDTYFYLTQEAASANKDDLAKTYQSAAISVEELSNWLTLEEWKPGQKGIRALKQVLILDTCAAGSAAGSLALKTKRELTGDQIRAIEFLKDKANIFILMGSAADAPSYEASQFGQGLLTYSLLQAMQGAALDRGEYVDVQTLFKYAANTVPGLAKDIGGVQMPIVKTATGNTFVIGQMTDTERRLIVLPSKKSMMLRPLLTNTETMDDDLHLIPQLRKMLDRESSFEVMRRSGRGEPVMIYIDDDNFPGGMRVAGSYTVEGDNVRITANLRQDGKTIAALPDVVGPKDKVVEQLVAVIRAELVRLHSE